MIENQIHESRVPLSLCSRRYVSSRGFIVWNRDRETQGTEARLHGGFSIVGFEGWIYEGDKVIAARVMNTCSF